MNVIFRLRDVIGKRIVTSCLSMMVGSVILIAHASAGLAQASSEENWSSIKQMDARIKRVKLQWSGIWETPAISNVDVKKDIEKTAAEMRAIGRNEHDIEAASQTIRKIDETAKVGTMRSARLTCTRVATTVKCDILWSPVRRKGIPPVTSKKSEISHVIDYFDGKNAVFLDAIGKDSPLYRGTVQTAEHALEHSVPDFAGPLFLLAGAITDRFPPQETLISEGLHNTLLLEKTINEGGYSALRRLTVSKKSWRPTRYEEINKLDGKVLVGYTTGESKVYADGIALPSSVTVKRGQVVEQYELQKAALNDQVERDDVNITSYPVLDDFRFGNGVRYRLKDSKIPDREEVEELRSRGAAEESLNNSQGNGHYPMSFAVPLAGLLMMAFGGILLRKEPHKNLQPKRNLKDRCIQFRRPHLAF